MRRPECGSGQPVWLNPGPLHMHVSFKLRGGRHDWRMACTESFTNVGQSMTHPTDTSHFAELPHACKNPGRTQTCLGFGYSPVVGQPGYPSPKASRTIVQESSRSNAGGADPQGLFQHMTGVLFPGSQAVTCQVVSQQASCSGLPHGTTSLLPPCALAPFFQHGCRLTGRHGHDCDPI